MIPVIAIVGRPNVGKSSLFNGLTQTHDAVVEDMPGVTRDRHYGKGRLGSSPYMVIDTGGIGMGEEGLEGLTAQQATQAISEAHVVLFIVDARAGLVSADQLIAASLRRLNKSIILVVNKVDGLNPDIAISDFHSLGLGKPIPISSAHHHNFDVLVETFSSYFPKDITAPLEDTEGIKIAIVGKPNAGKSTLINRFLGEERVIVSDVPGTTRDSIYVSLERLGKKYILIDTAGVRRRSQIIDKVEKISVVKTLQAIDDASVVVFLIDARQNISEQDLNLLGFVIELGKALVVAINKWDGLRPDDREAVKKALDRRCGFINFAKTRFISALHGTGVGDLFEDVDVAYGSAMKKASTPLLNRLLQQATQQHQPPMIKGHRIKLRYAHQGGHNPPVIVIHGNQTKNLPGSYIRFLQAFFRKALRLVGTPVQFEFKEGENPYHKGNKRPVTISVSPKRALARTAKRKPKKT
jgi:GTP-binding protein